MPCNSVAMVQAQVAQAHLARLLSGPVIAPVLEQFLTAQYPGWVLQAGTPTATGVQLRLGAYQIAVVAGQVTVIGPERALADTLAQQITALLTAAAGQLFQQQVQAALAARYALTDEQRAPNGALVLTLTV